MLAVVGRVKVNVLPFDGAPEALDEGVIGGAAPAVAADTAAGGEQGLLVSEAGKLAALVGIEDVRGRSVAQGRVQGLQANVSSGCGYTGERGNPPAALQAVQS